MNERRKKNKENRNRSAKRNCGKNAIDYSQNVPTLTLEMIQIPILLYKTHEKKKMKNWL